MGCTDTVSTVGSVPGRRVAPGEETQNRVARWEACRRTNRNTHACESTARSNTRCQGCHRIRGVHLGGSTAWHSLSPHTQGACFFPLNSSGCLDFNTYSICTLLLLLFLASTNVFFPPFFFFAFSRSAAWFCLHMADVVKQ